LLAPIWGDATIALVGDLKENPCIASDAIFLKSTDRQQSKVGANQEPS